MSFWRETDQFKILMIAVDRSFGTGFFVIQSGHVEGDFYGAQGIIDAVAAKYKPAAIPMPAPEEEASGSSSAVDTKYTV